MGPGERVDTPAGASEEPEFLGSRDERMFGMRHLPDGPIRGGVVIASPVHGEMVKNYRREVLVARELAVRGFAVQRFHYRGTGHSHGDGEDLTLDSMVEDLDDARRALTRATGVEQPVLLGTRLGALAAIAANDRRGPVALWEPIVAPARHLREMDRMRTMRAAANRAEKAESIADELARHEVVDVLGYPVTKGFVTSLQGFAIDAAPVPAAGFVLQMRKRETLEKSYLELQTTWEAQGCPTEVTSVVDDSSWWFARDAATGDWTYATTRPGIEATCSWIERVVDEGAP